MEYFSLMAIAILLCYASYPNKVKKLERDIKKIKKANGEGLEMSKIISGLVGKTCKMTVSERMSDLENVVILEVDTEWVKLQITNKKEIQSIEIIRIDDIKSISQISE